MANGDSNQGVEEQEWVENTTLTVDGGRKDAGESSMQGVRDLVSYKTLINGFVQDGCARCSLDERVLYSG